MNFHWWQLGSQKRPRTARGPSRGSRARGAGGRLALTRLEDRTVPDAVGISLAAAGGVPNGVSSQPSVSSDGGLVAFASAATNLVTGQTDANGTTDIFLYNRNAGTTTLNHALPRYRISSSSGGLWPASEE